MSLHNSATRCQNIRSDAVACSLRKPGLATTLSGCVLLAACSAPLASMPRGPEAYTALSDAAAAMPKMGMIRTADTLNVRVLFEPDLSRDNVRVGEDGVIDLPFVGAVQAAGLTPSELSQQVEASLSNRLTRPKVDVTIANAASSHVVVEGNVNEPGVYDIAGNTTLLEAIARARSTKRTAALDQVVIFRTVNHQRMGAVFDVSRIRRGIDDDPCLLPGDIVVVGFSEIKGLYRDFLEFAPTIALFRPY